MTNQQSAPEALRLANSITWMDAFTDFQRDELDKAAAELRRLHAENERLAALVEAQQPAPSAAGAQTAQRLRAACLSVRTKSYPLSDLIPLMQEAADALTVTPTPQADSVLLEDAALPMQPICVTADGVVRFKKNRMVNDMYEFSQPRGFGLNEMARRDYTQEERMQFAQLIGYSVSGYGGLSYASPESAAKADTMAEAFLAARKQGGA